MSRKRHRSKKHAEAAAAVAESNGTPGSDDIPRFPPYDPQLFWKIDWRALPADLAFIAFGFVLSFGYFGEESVFVTLTPQWILGLFLVAVVAVCWYVGFIYGRYRMFYSKGVQKTAGWILAAATITLLGYLMALVVTIGADEKYTGTATEDFAMFATFMVVIGPLFSIGGYMTSTQVAVMGLEPKKKEGDPSPDETFYACVITILITIYCLVTGSMSDFVQESSVSGLWIVAVFIGSAFAGVLAALFLMGVKKALVAIGLYYRLASIFETALPFVIISSLIFWNELQRHYLSGFSTGGMLGVLFFTGILPFRLVLIFNPPLRAINLLIGIACFLFYLWSL